MVLAPDRQEDGTNILQVNPPGYIPFAFGVGSFRRHVMLAEESGATVKIYRSDRAALDIDTPDDLTLYERMVDATQPHSREPHPEGNITLTE